jgi:hypothetical protein
MELAPARANAPPPASASRSDPELLSEPKPSRAEPTDPMCSNLFILVIFFMFAQSFNISVSHFLILLSHFVTMNSVIYVIVNSVILATANSVILATELSHFMILSVILLQ